MAELPPVLAGHWTTPEGHEMAQRYAGMSRADLSMPDRPDLGLANALYLVDGEIVIQTAAKERMRWLSVQLAISQAALKTAEAFMAGFEGDQAQETLDADLAEVRAAVAQAEGRADD